MKRTIAALLTLTAVSLFVAAGCGGKTKDGDGKGPGKKARLSEKIVGTWTGGMAIPDEEKYKADVTAEMKAAGALVDDTTIQEDIKALKAMKITMTFNDDGTASMKMEGMGPKPSEQSGKWELVKETDKELTVKLTAEGKKDMEMVLTFEGDDRITTSPPMPMTGVIVVYDRKK